jgi:hypothetical protein
MRVSTVNTSPGVSVPPIVTWTKKMTSEVTALAEKTKKFYVMGFYVMARTSLMLGQ